MKRRTHRQKNGKKSGWRIFFRSFVACVVACLGVALLSVPVLRYLESTDEAGAAFRNKISIPGGGWRRGSIFDRSQQELATTIERVSVYVRSREITSIKETADELAQIFELDSVLLEDRLKRGGLRSWIAEDITQVQEEELIALALPGVHLQRKQKRFYPYGTDAAHVIGFAESGVGLEGVEMQYDRLLAEHQYHGIQNAGKRREAGDLLLPLFELHLTLDLQIQHLLNEALNDIKKQSVAYCGNTRIAAYVMECKSGAILAGGQVPEFNPNHFADYGSDVLENIFFTPLFIPHKYRIFLRDSGVLYGTENSVAKAGLWSAAQFQHSREKQSQFLSFLNFEKDFPVDFYNKKKSSLSTTSPLVIPNLLSKREVPFAEAIPKATTPMHLLVAMSTILHGMPVYPPHAIESIVDLSDDKKRHVMPEMEGKELVLERGVVTNLFKALGVRRKGEATYLRDQTTGGIVDKNGAMKIVHHDVTYVDIPDGKKPLGMLLVIETTGSGPLTLIKSKRKKMRSDIVKIEDALDRRVRRISVRNMVADDAEGLFTKRTKDYGNYQAKQRFIVGNDGKLSGIQAQETEKNITAKMPELKGLSLRKSFRLLQGIPVELIVVGTGRVVDQRPSAGTELKEGMQCRLTLKRDADVQFKTQR